MSGIPIAAGISQYVIGGRSFQSGWANGVYAMLLFGAQDEVAAMPTDFGVAVTARLSSAQAAPSNIQQFRVFARLVCTENLNPAVLVMESAENRARPYASGALSRANGRLCPKTDAF
jgi:hypothetical protein